jgi:AraC family transcriptional regulator
VKSFTPVTLGSPRFHTVDVEGFLITEAHFAAHDELPIHRHQRPTLAVMLDGFFDVTFPGKVLPCSPGAFHTEPAEERHGNRMGRTGAHVVVVQPSPRRLESLRRFSRLFDDVHHRPASPLGGMARRLALEIRTGDDAAPLAMEGLALELMAMAARGESRGATDTRPPRWLRRTQDLIHARFTDRLRMTELAEVAAVHPDHLARSFRRHFGQSIAEYLRGLRLDWAAQALRETDDPVPAIAHRAGFADQSHFTREFRRRTGVTPARFRAS